MKKGDLIFIWDSLNDKNAPYFVRSMIVFNPEIPDKAPDGSEIPVFTCIDTMREPYKMGIRVTEAHFNLKDALIEAIEKQRDRQKNNPCFYLTPENEEKLYRNYDEVIALLKGV